MTYKVLDLFSGIGGFSLGLDRAGFETVAFCEIEKYPRKILKKHWPDVPVFEDVRKLNLESLKDVGIKSIDVVCGGFPCQPFSVAGKQAGKEDDRHLWPEMFRLIKETRPRWVIGENVAGFINMALDDVLSDLESEGYKTQSFVIPACAVGGIHRRDRVWIVANSGDCWRRDCEQQRNSGANKQREKSVRSGSTNEASRSSETFISMADSDRTRSQSESITREDERVWAQSNDKQFVGRFGSQPFRPIEPPTESPIRHRNDGLPDNVARLKALGNAVVPQIPEIIGRAIMENNY